jgi:hypothetical protein
MNDKRQWQRIDVDLEAECNCVAQVGEKFRIRVININEQGLCCAVPMTLKPGQKVNLAIDLKVHGKAFLSAKVIWSGYFEKTEQYRAGLRIVDCEPEEHEVFLRFYNFLALQKHKAA